MHTVVAELAGQMAQASPQSNVPALHVRPHFSPSQVASPFGSVGHAMQEAPHASTVVHIPPPPPLVELAAVAFGPAPCDPHAATHRSPTKAAPIVPRRIARRYTAPGSP